MTESEGIEPPHPMKDGSSFPIRHITTLSTLHNHLVAVDGLEPPTYRLSSDCSSTELHRYMAEDEGIEPPYPVRVASR